ncbi:hypothetical protein [Brevibacillus laterosporus]|uniref:hypothetical protein n=2 Tax=Brevibacillus laterosporus TaxID=1465 RepID=UPI001F1089F4|nr:hypothetical protein [Brevibacillus laterosporus]WNX29585.1 hypothetical protein RWW94_15230 [Brevibacillus laterosporus]
MSSNQVLEVKIENLHRELNSFKEETKEDIRDINLSIKQSEKLFNDAIVTMTENITKLTTIADQQREEMRQQREEIRLIRESKEKQNAEIKNFFKVQLSAFNPICGFKIKFDNSKQRLIIYKKV